MTCTSAAGSASVMKSPPWNDSRWLKPLASARSHRLPGGAPIRGVQLLAGSNFTQEPSSWNRLFEVSNNVLDDLMIHRNGIKHKQNTGPVGHRDFSSPDSNPGFSNRGFYKRVKKFTLREEEFAKTTTGKIKRYLYTDREKSIPANGEAEPSDN